MHKHVKKQAPTSFYPQEDSKYILMTVSETQEFMTCLSLVIAHFLAHELLARHSTGLTLYH